MNIFLSYSANDRPIAKLISDRLLAAGHKTWFDFSGIPGGSNWVDEILNSLNNSDVMLVLMSPDSNQSKWVQREVLWALDKKKPIYPVMVRQAEPPLFLVNLQYLDLTENLDSGIIRLIESLKQPEAPPLTEKPALSGKQIKESIQRLEEEPLPERVFIAYSRKQRLMAKELADLLRSNGKSVFYDAHIRAGARWRQTIQKALDDATHMVLLWTPDAAESDEVYREVTYALGESVYVIPLLSPDVPKLPYHLYGLQYIVLKENMSEIIDELLKAFEHRTPDEGIWQQ